MIEKEDWIKRHKLGEKGEEAWKAFKHYCLNCGFKTGKRNGQEVIFSPAHERETLMKGVKET